MSQAQTESSVLSKDTLPPYISIYLCVLFIEIVMFWFSITTCSGYMPPEYAIDGHFSVKSDVFSFGVLVLEIITGKTNRGFRHADHDLNLLGHVSYRVSAF